MGPCAKKVVRCTITARSGDVFVGENSCLTPQATCPRLPGEGYGKCVTVCHQQGHAEYRALFAAGHKAWQSTALIEGITYACRACQEALYGAGVQWIRVAARPPERRPPQAPCALGVGCDESGVCYAGTMNHPERCGRLP